MTTPPVIHDSQILGSKLRRRFLKAAHQNPGTGGRLFKNRTRALPRLELLEDRMLLASYSVTSNADTNTPGTLRYAINLLDTSGGASNTITFDIGGGGYQTITPGSALPSITKSVDIKGNTQPGFSGAPLVEITGGLAGSVNGLTLDFGSSGSVVQSLVINSFAAGAGIRINSSSNTVIGSYLGTDVSGASAKANYNAVYISGSGNTIGGTSTGAGNVSSGSIGSGILLDDTSTSDLVEGNLIGTNAAGNAALHNGDGILISGSGTIGGTSAGATNVISGNQLDGVDIDGSCLVEGNLIGTNAAGNAALANNGTGINVVVSDATIGGTSADAGNVISGNQGDGVNIQASCLVEGNRIGTNAAGNAALANTGAGIFVVISGATIGGSSSSAANLISGNSLYGVDIRAACVVEGNLIGTNLAGNAAVPNGDGIFVTAGSTGATIGGASSSAANVISGNSLYGVDIEASCLVEGNLIGTNQAGTAAVANIGDGIYVGVSGATIGGTSAGAGNVISGNFVGVEIHASCLVEGNLIGIDAAGNAALANGYSGIFVVISGATIGGTSSSAANVISGNSLYGVDIRAACVVEGNLIGTNLAGNAAVPNGGSGIAVIQSGATIGGISAGAANVISGNSLYGVYIEASCLVEGNLIGIDAAGNAALANGYSGIDVIRSGATIGGTSGGAGNVISGNVYDGFDIYTSCLVEGNMIGTDQAGNAALANGRNGVLANSLDSSGSITIGGTSAGAGNVISGNGLTGIAGSCLAEGNLIGTDVTGAAAVPNGTGIFVDSPGATIGGTAAGAANIISGNGSYGVDIEASCLVEGNLIGTNQAGSAAVPNAVDGIYVGASGATIGGASSSAANVISGNSSYGVDIEASCLFEGNLIGTNLAGTASVANYLDGIVVGASGTTIGGSSAGTGNVISGNNLTGIVIEASCLVEGNQIGTDVTGTAAVPNGTGIVIRSPAATIGGISAGAANVISGNTFAGVFTIASCLVEGNLIGIDAAGNAALANGNSGIVVNSSSATIGGISAGTGNVISGNGSYGVDIEASCLVEGNLIGTNAAGTAAVGNTLGGIYAGGAGATIGGTSAGAGNVISGNGNDGVDIYAACLVEDNLIGTDKTGANPVKNQAIGVFLAQASAAGSTIGVADSGNIIAFNGGPGVATAPGTTGSPIRYNSIFSNSGPGIDLNDDGVTPNTPIGANNTPVLSSAGSSIISGTLNASPDSTYIVDYYANPSSDASAARPQGRAYLGSTTVATNAQGNVGFIFSYTPIGGEPFVTATATDISGTTSEFSAPVAYAIAPSGLAFNATVGVPFQGTVASFSTSDLVATAAAFTATINYGDGTASSAGTVLAAPGGFIVVGSHTFAIANPTTPVTVTITDTLSAGQATANSLANVVSPGGLLTPFGHSVEFVAGTLFSRVVAGFTDSDPRAFPGQFKATIAWGDGATSSTGVVSSDGAGVVSADGAGFDVTGAHTYNVAGAYPVTVTITDTISGAMVTAKTTATVDPVQIAIQTRNFAVTGRKNFSGIVATFTDGDPRIDPTFYAATINWGDGLPSSTGVITGANPFKVTASHTFSTFQNTDLVTITIVDKNGRTATGVDRVVDPPVDLAIQAGGLTLSRNQPFQGIVATFTDSGPSEPASAYKATINWGKGRKSAGMIVGSNGQFVVSAKHVFPRFFGTKTVTVTLTDTQGRVVSLSESASYAVLHPKVIRATHPAKIASKSRRFRLPRSAGVLGGARGRLWG